MIDQIRAADGVFCPNESSTLGMLLALRNEDLAGKVKFVGFDASPPLVEALANGEIHALVVQNPDRMGYEGVRHLVRHLDGESVPASVDTGVVVVTADQLADPAIQKLLE
jgi:ribose transport system substrate-binding protein